MMTRYIKFVCLVTSLCTAVAFAQVTPAGSSVAFVYVSSAVSGNSYEISAFAAASNGKLTRVSGSPFSADVQNMAVNGKYLFGTDGIEIYSFSIASDGRNHKLTLFLLRRANQPGLLQPAKQRLRLGLGSAPQAGHDHDIKTQSLGLVDCHQMHSTTFACRGVGLGAQLLNLLLQARGLGT